MKIDIVYKVIREYEDQLVSAMYDNIAYPILYQENQWNYSMIGKIFVFDNLESACFFARGVAYSRTFKCAALNCINMRNRLLLTYAKEHYYMYKYWEGKKYNHMLRSTPEGTLGADAIYLLEKV